MTIEEESGPTIAVGTLDPNDPMEVHRAITIFSRDCEASLNIHTPQIDGGPIYGSDEAYVQTTLREPGTCFLRTSVGNLLPVSTRADAEGRFFFVAGDVRVSEHAFLTAQHHVRRSVLMTSDEANLPNSIIACAHHGDCTLDLLCTDTQ